MKPGQLNLETLERALQRALGVALVLALLEGVAGLLLFSLGTDEAWFLSSLQGLVKHPEPALAVNVTLTSGGVFALVHWILIWAGADVLIVHRLVSLLSLLLAVVLLARWLRSKGRTRAGVRLAIAALASTPGALVFAATSNAEAVALLLLLLMVVAWERSEERPVARWLGCGALIGLLMATRASALILPPSLLVWSVLERSGRARRLRDAIVSSAVGMLVLAACVGLQLLHTAPEALPPVGRTLGFMGVIGILLDYPQILNAWILAQRFVPLYWMTLITAVAWWLARRGERGLGDPWTLLIVFAWIAWGVWIFRSPIPHLRYLWPALGGLWVGLGIVLTGVYHLASGREGAPIRVLCTLIALACLTGQLASTFRHLVHGESNIISWEWSGESKLDYYRRFAYVQDQRATARYLREHVGSDEWIGIFENPFALRYLSGQRVRRLRDWQRKEGSEPSWHASELPRWLVLTPTIGSLRHLTPAGYAWLEANCALEIQFGSYSIYRVTGEYPEDPEVLETYLHPTVSHPHSKPRFGYGEG